MSKLPGFLVDKRLDSYTHLKTNVNLDVEPGVVHLSLSNAKDKAAYKALPAAYKATKIMATSDMLKEYSCVSGLVSLDKSNMKNIDKIHAAMMKVMQEHPPYYS
jgi:hypothetical protein